MGLNVSMEKIETLDEGFLNPITPRFSNPMHSSIHREILLGRIYIPIRKGSPESLDLKSYISNSLRLQPILKIL